MIDKQALEPFGISTLALKWNGQTPFLVSLVMGLRRNGTLDSFYGPDAKAFLWVTDFTISETGVSTFDNPINGVLPLSFQAGESLDVLIGIYERVVGGAEAILGAKSYAGIWKRNQYLVVAGIFPGGGGSEE